MKNQLKEKGFFLIKNAISNDEINEISKISTSLLGRISKEDRDLHKGLGSIIPIEYHTSVETFWKKSLPLERIEEILEGKLDIIYGVIFSKPINANATFWHQDALYWDQKEAYTDQVIQVNILIYLSDTDIHSGCLRVIPGSHRKKNCIHTDWQKMLSHHGNNLSKVTDLLRRGNAQESWLLSSKEDMEAIPSQKGDLIILDSRLLHGTFPNKILDERILHSFSGFIDNAKIAQTAIEVLKNKQFNPHLRLPDLGRMQ